MKKRGENENSILIHHNELSGLSKLDVKALFVPHREIKPPKTYFNNIFYFECVTLMYFLRYRKLLLPLNGVYEERISYRQSDYNIYFVVLAQIPYSFCVSFKKF